MPADAAPLVSLGMPVYNGERYIAQAIESILAQTLTDFELIVCDNTSTDGTESIARSYAEKDPRVHYHRNDHNLGAHPNFNKSFRLSSGKYFKWAPHDDVLHPQYIEQCVNALENSADSVLCQSHLLYIDEGGETIGVYDSALSDSQSDSAARRFASLLLQAHPSYEVMGLYRRSALTQTNLLESFHGADRELLAEMALQGKFVQIAEPLLLVRDHKERYTRSQLRPRDRANWHDSRLNSRFSLPTWRLYRDYWHMIPHHLSDRNEKMRCYAVLVRWWGRNWNAARMLVDLAAAVVPDATYHAERFKHKLIAPAPGADTSDPNHTTSK